ncbi:MAG TPA: MDR family oxidoreductase [Alphaproteobacteria bacterium]
MGRFEALVLDEREGKVVSSIRNLSDEDLPPGDVTIRVEYSTLNYKDGLILNGLGRLVRKYPHVPGIDFAGVVETSQSAAYKPGDRVVLTGWRVGELHWGGYAQRARVKSEWLVPLPPALSTKRAMAIGTAGLTAMLAIMALEEHGLRPGEGEILVSGAAGGLGSVAVAILNKLGYDVAASTGRAEQHEYLRALGAKTIIPRAELSLEKPKPLQSERWHYAIDTVGGLVLANVLTAMRYGTAVAVCGNAGGNELSTTVLPLILRGVDLLGIDSVMKPLAIRKVAWERLARDLPLDQLDAMTTVVGLKDLPELGARILQGQVRGRVVVDMGGGGPA